MNAIIAELIVQCTDTIDILNPDTGITHYREFFNHEKFAELIAQECINVANERKKWVEDQEVFDARDREWNNARIQQSQHIVDKIKQHFGIEE